MENVFTCKYWQTHKILFKWTWTMSLRFPQGRADITAHHYCMKIQVITQEKWVASKYFKLSLRYMISQRRLCHCWRDQIQLHFLTCSWKADVLCGWRVGGSPCCGHQNARGGITLMWRGRRWTRPRLKPCQPAMEREPGHHLHEPSVTGHKAHLTGFLWPFNELLLKSSSALVTSCSPEFGW